MSRKRQWHASGWHPLWSFVGLSSPPQDAEWATWLVSPLPDSPPSPSPGPDSSPLIDVLWAVRRDLARKRAEGHIGNNGTQQGPPDTLRGVPSVRVDWPNVVWTTLRSPTAAALHALVGDALMRYLLLYCRLIAPIPARSSVYLQLSGPPLLLGPVSASFVDRGLSSTKLQCDSMRSRKLEQPRDKRTKEVRATDGKKRKAKEGSDVSERKAAQAARKRERECRRKEKRDKKKAETLKNQAEGKPIPNYSNARLYRKPPPPKSSRTPDQPHPNPNNNNNTGNSAHPPAERYWSPATDLLPRAAMFYNTASSRRSGLPTRHFLNSADDTAAFKSLISAVRGSEQMRLPKESEKEIGLLVDDILKRHRRMSNAVYAQLLAHHAPLPQGLFSRQDAAGAANSQFTQLPEPLPPSPQRPPPPDYASFATRYSSIHQVERFLLAVWRRLVPPSLYGNDDNNSKHLEHCVSLLVRLRRHETLSVHYLLQHFSLSPLPYVPSVRLGPHHQAIAQRIAGRLLRWVFAEILIPLVAHSFYATETSLPTAGRLRVFYYRKAVWARLAALSMEQMMKHGHLRKVESEEEAARISGVAKLGAGIPRLRLVPKAQKVRPIVNLGSRRHKVSVNGLLGNAHSVLSAERKARPHMFGCAIFKTEDAYEGLVNFARARAASSQPNARVFMCSVDVLNCFDSLKHAQVLSVLEDLLSREQYVIHYYGKADLDSEGCVTRIARAERAVDASPVNAYQFSVVIDHLRSRSSIITDLARFHVASRLELLQQLRAHIKGHVVTLRGSLYLQTEGVPQGSVVSPLLTAAAYARLEAELLPAETSRHAISKDRDVLSSLSHTPPTAAPVLLLRHTDDFVFLSTDESKARHFLLTMDRGFPSYGVRIHPEKSQANFAAQLSNGKPVGRGRGSDGEISWCGLLLDPAALEVRVDYTRFSTSPVSESLTVEHCRSPGRKFRAKLLQFARAKSHCLLFDSQLNSVFTVRLIVYQAMLFLALRFEAYLCEWRAETALAISVLADVIDYVRVRIEGGGRAEQAQRMNCKITIPAAEVYWLGLRAFARVLQRRPSRHLELLKWLHKRLHRTSMRQLEEELRSVTNDELSRVLLDMKK